MRDFLGKQLNVGDIVVHGVGGRYGGLSGPYVVHSFTPKMVRIMRVKATEPEKTCPSYNLVKVAP